MENSTRFATNITTQNAAPGSIPVFQAIITFVLAGVMFGMGCDVDHEKLKANLKRPVGVIVGLACQIILMPVLTYTLIKIFQLAPVQSLSLALIGFSPGGGNSNVITYLVKGDMSLSVTMTTCSNTLALATFPLWILIYTEIENITDELRINFLSLAITLLSIALPIAAGILFRYKFPKKASLVPRVSATIGMVLLVITLVAMFVITKIDFEFSTDTFLPVGLLPILGMGLAYLISCIPSLKLHNSARRAIGIETAIQNKTIPNSALVLTFGNRLDIFRHAVTIPLIYIISQTAIVISMVAAYRLWLCTCKSPSSEEQREDKRSTIVQLPEAMPLRRCSPGGDIKDAVNQLTA